MKTVYDCEKVVQEKILEVREHSTPFDGSLQEETVPDLLYDLVRWTLGGFQVGMLDDSLDADPMPYIG